MQTSTRCSVARESDKSFNMGRQMTVDKTGAPKKRKSWSSISWETARKFVVRLQMRIAKAVQEGRHGKVKALQWLLTHSFYAKALAVKRVTSNKGKKTPLTEFFGRIPERCRWNPLEGFPIQNASN